MLQIKNLHYSIGDRRLMNGLDWLIQPGKRAALVGPNGTGKTTLLRILNGELEHHGGEIVKPKEYRIGYLPQEELPMEGRGILQTVLDGQAEIKQLEQEIQRLHEALEINDDRHEVQLKQLERVEQRYEALDGYHVDLTARNILCGLGFERDQLSRPLSEFSGGWRMRVYLAILLVQRPDLLLLDEPTNHLDIPSLEWLEQYLLGFKGSIIMVSHDRFFIDRLSQEIAELYRGKLTHYSGNYHFFERRKEENDALQQKHWKEQQVEKERQERFINRFRYKDSKASQVQSRIKLLEKMVMIEPPETRPRLNFRIKVETSSYNDVLMIDDLSFRYEEDWVLRHMDLEMYRGDRVCLIGANGAGKTTLTRLISQEFMPREGSLKLGERVSIGYYAQHQVEALNLDATIFEEVASSVATSLFPRIRDVLGVFQFTGQDVNKRIGVLSGGEKARVSLAKILISPVNFLVMDEPTNHLDKNAKEALEHALEFYDGTLLLISHDRYFLDKLVHRVVELKDGKFYEYEGNYSYYLEKRESLRKLANAEQQVKKEDGKTVPPVKNGTAAADDSLGKAKKSKEQKRQEAQARQAISSERNQLQKKVDQLEEGITRLEAEQQELEARMAHPDTYNDSQLAVDLQKRYGVVNKELETLTAQWETAQLELDELLAQL